MATLFRRNDSYGYTMMEKETPEDKNHREAQFLIYKTLKKVDDQIIARRSSRPCWLKLRICKLKVRIGKKLLRLRKTILSSMVKSKVGVYNHVLLHLKTFKRLFRGGSGGREGGAAISRLSHPLFT